ncbi:26406_t:CDS:2 [Dentiscutata erythropus]|uniref:26406_t:CDS:1 n=1 Tax=Dentiscutata erythropus TaxID=1348616 RepID=A0A9N8WKM6_9GLOM|nr:26406_t:CDS:2 [Dentiscutata erythropus]
MSGSTSQNYAKFEEWKNNKTKITYLRILEDKRKMAELQNETKPRLYFKPSEPAAENSIKILTCIVN